MKEKTAEILAETIIRYPVLAGVESDIEKMFGVLSECFENGGRLYVCGNGGSAADCEHIAGELLKSFKLPRPLPESCKTALKEYGAEGETLVSCLENGLPVISLCGHAAFSTAYANDRNPDLVFAQQVNVWGRGGDVLLTLSTSGNSKNCVYAAIAAKAKGMSVAFLGGGDGGRLASFSDASVVVPEKETYKVQELHLPVYHCLCAMLESEFFG